MVNFTRRMFVVIEALRVSDKTLLVDVLQLKEMINQFVWSFRVSTILC